MQQRTLGNAGPVVSAIGLGCMGFSQGYGAVDDDESVAAIHTAIDSGATLFDTAQSYGGGHNERLLARALRGAGPQVRVATKFGIVRGADGVHLDAKPERVREYCDASLARLGREVIDLYYLHRVDPEVPIAETIGAMAELVRAGKVRNLGVSEVNPEQLAQAAAVHPIAAVQFEWSMLWREPERDVVPAARELGAGLVPYSPLGRGLLTATLTSETVTTSDFRRNDPRFAGENLASNMSRVEALRALADRLGITPGQLALTWLLAQGPDVAPIPGSRRAARIVENLAAASIELGADDRAELDKIVADGWAGDRQSFAAHGTSRSDALSSDIDHV
ncbi:aldo/keto reductase [Nocardia macrotermitis]|uniref:Aldo-keto reductase IolS n=1 Tax=Nocardia macrotermitis TaxID=2585198 RepID=A0A7K0D162_9NOCA|nr:aldo/keto reductase [Nocardia macrotermitis]MQY19453.1 Aldo-keto reductase IolS [Nocardia macrotermitis]